MTSLATMPAASPSGLRRDYLSFAEVFSQSVANIAPSATPALIVPLVFASAGNGTWFSYLLATITMLLVAVQVNYFARRSSSPGSLYSFVSCGLGPTWGVVAGWSLIIAYIFTGSAVLAGATNYATVLVAGLGAGSRWFSAGFMIAAAAAALAIAYKDVKLSTRSMLIVEFTSVGLILWLALAFLRKAPVIWDTEQWRLVAATPAGIRQGLVLAVFSYVGFESATALGDEARDPLRTIPRSVLLSVVAVGAMFVFMSYILVVAFHGQTTPLSQSNAPLSVLAQLAGEPAFGYAIAVGAVISFFACALASINAAARVIFSMARHGLFHASQGAAHKKHATPHGALVTSSVLALAAPLTLALRGRAPAEAFGYLGSIATFGFLFAYVLVSVAAPIFLKHENLLSIGNALVAVVTIALLALPLAGSVYPVPDAPSSYLPFIFLFLMALGLGWFFLRRRRE